MKLLIDAVTWFSHILQNLIRHMFRCHTQLPTYVMFHQFTQKSLVPVCHHIIKAYTGADEYLLHFWNVTQFFQKFDIVSVIYFQIRTRLREQALAVLTHATCKLFFAGWLAEVRRRTSYVVDIAFEVLFLRNHLRLI